MAGNLPARGEPTLLDELDSVDLVGRTVRVTGRLENHNYHRCVATLTDPQTGAHVGIDTQLIEPFDAKKGSLFQVIGECEFCSDGSGNNVIVKAHVIRCVDGMDIIMYKKSLISQREYLHSR